MHFGPLHPGDGEHWPSAQPRRSRPPRPHHPCPHDPNYEPAARRAGYSGGDSVPVPDDGERDQVTERSIRAVVVGLSFPNQRDIWRRIERGIAQTRCRGRRENRPLPAIIPRLYPALRPGDMRIVDAQPRMRVVLRGRDQAAVAEQHARASFAARPPMVPARLRRVNGRA